MDRFCLGQLSNVHRTETSDRARLVSAAKAFRAYITSVHWCISQMILAIICVLDFFGQNGNLFYGIPFRSKSLFSMQKICYFPRDPLFKKENPTVLIGLLLKRGFCFIHQHISYLCMTELLSVSRVLHQTIARVSSFAVKPGRMSSQKSCSFTGFPHVGGKV